jgi:hypothetical protein
MTGAETPHPEEPPRRRTVSLLRCFAGAVLFYVVVAYGVLPLLWHRHEKRHPALADTAEITHTASGIPGDPLNVALVGTGEDIHLAMLAAKWYPADPITLKSAMRIAVGVVFERPYDDAPVSGLYLWGRKEDLAYEQPVGDDPRRRHHVRFWRSEKVDEEGKPLWMGAATLDIRVGLSHTTGEITHHIAPDVDLERNKVINDIKQADDLSAVYWVDGFHKELQGKNGGGDPWHTDGRLAVGVIAMRSDSRSAVRTRESTHNTGEQKWTNDKTLWHPW